MTNSRTKGRFMMTMGLLLTAAALLLTGYNLLEERNAQKNASEALTVVAEMIPTEDAGAEADANAERPSGVASDAQDEFIVPEFVEDPGKEMTVAFVDGQAYIGVVEIPELELKLPIISEWNDERLKIAPCRYVGSAYTFDLIISGHSYKNHFRYIRNLERGDDVYFTDMDGNRFVYEVSDSEVLDGSDVAGMLVGDWDLTLFTCTYGGASRHTIRCKLVEDENPWMEYRLVDEDAE